jgi:hypothetical protein
MTHTCVADQVSLISARGDFDGWLNIPSIVRNDFPLYDAEYSSQSLLSKCWGSTPTFTQSTWS